MANPYPAGQLFIRVKSPIAVLIIIAGVVQAALLLASWVAEIKQLRYRPATELKSCLAQVAQEQTAAHEGVAQFLNQAAVKATLPLSVELPDAPSSPADFEACQKSLAQLRLDSAELKKLLSAHIDARLSPITATMQAHVESRRKEKNAAAPSAEPTAALPPRLFVAGDKAALAAQRAAELAGLVGPLEERASNPVNRQNLAALRTDLNAFAEWLAKQEKGQAASQVAEASLDSERILRQIQDAFAKLKQSSSDAWRLDATLDQFERTLDVERRQCAASLERIEKSRFDHLARLASILLGSLLGAAAVLIFADFLKAHFANASRDSKGSA
jgi:hypothetical protein